MDTEIVGHKWAEPSLEELRSVLHSGQGTLICLLLSRHTMRRVYQDKREASMRAKLGRESVLHCCTQDVVSDSSNPTT